jgi:glycerophosphoryl diester phosphodiesterase
LNPANTRRPLVVAHRGDSRNFPENTLEAVKGAIALGVDIIELDVHRSADDVAMIIHDRDLKRTTGRSGQIDSMAAVEIDELDAGSWRGAGHAGARVPRLANVIAAIGESDVRLCLEFKDGDYRAPDDAAGWLVDQFARFALHRRAIVNLANIEIAARVKRLDADIRIALDFNPETTVADASVLVAAGVSVVEVDHRFVNVDLMRDCGDTGLPVWAWTANAPADWERLRAAGVDAIMTDDPAGLIAYLADGAETRRGL